jgi:EAL domain-containing protein (putative c-di-GMP-specific phosphodiesterase class I)
MSMEWTGDPLRDRRLSLVPELPGAVGRGELLPYYQPQLDVASGRIVGAEALARWRHPRLGMVPPSEFIPVAEEIGAIREIGEFMIDQACAFAASMAYYPVQISVNVSALQLADPEFGARLTETFTRHGLKPGQLTIELTESRPIADIPDAGEQLGRLRELGIGISIDDFGIGHSSLKQLESLPFTELKIDQSLIRDDTDETWTRVASIVAIVRHRGLRIVAEGIETQEQYDRVRDAGCDRVQGYLLGMPMPAEEFVEFCRDNVRTPIPQLGRVANRALADAGLRNLETLATWTRRDVAALHGIGPKGLARLTTALAALGLGFAAVA